MALEGTRTPRDSARAYAGCRRVPCVTAALVVLHPMLLGHSAAAGSAALVAPPAVRPNAPPHTGQAPTRPDTVVAGTRVAVADTELVLHRDGAERRVAVAEQVGADSAVRALVVDVRGEPGRLYVLLYVDGAARARLGARACAREAGLVWAAFDAGLRPLAVRGVRTESCAALRNQVEPYDQPPSAYKGVVNVFYDQQPGAERHNVWYATRHPERGLHDEVLR